MEKFKSYMDEVIRDFNAFRVSLKKLLGHDSPIKEVKLDHRAWTVFKHYANQLIYDKTSMALEAMVGDDHFRLFGISIVGEESLIEIKSLSESKRVTTLLAGENKKLREKCEKLEKLARDAIDEIGGLRYHGEGRWLKRLEEILEGR